MKFTDGYWQIKPGITPAFPVHAHDVETGPDSLTVYAATRPIRHRGDTLEGPLITVRFSSPLANIIRVQVTHFKGARPRRPEFPLNAPGAPVTIQDSPEAATLTSGDLTARVERAGDWKIDFLDGQRPVARSGWRGMGVMETPAGPQIYADMSLSVGEIVYGLGERFTAFTKNGQVVEMWNEDGGTSSELAYKNIPFFMTNRGYGVFVSHPEKVSFEVASEKVERVQFSVPGQSLDYYVIYGPTPKEVLERYTALTGRPALPPPWTFGLWLTTSFTTDYDEATVTSFIQGMADRDIPLHVFHYDCFWMKEFQWVDFEWDRRVFPDPQGMLQRLKERGLRICVWINPYIAQRSALFDEGMAGGFLVKTPAGDVWQWDRWQPGMALVDFTNPAACRWFGDKLGALVEMGVDCFKTDFGERIPTEVAWFDGSDPLKMHNYYTYLYNQTVFGVLEEKLGVGEAAVFARSATAGSQQFPVHWGGDCSANYDSMAETLRGGLSLGLSGFGFWSHDMGGFEHTASADVYKRWCAFGLLSSHSRLHGSSSYRVPWLFEEEDTPAGQSATDVLRYFTRLKCRLMPYLFGAAVEAHQQGAPLLRAMLLEFPADPGCDTLDRQYMLGGSLLVAPVFRPDGIVDYYLPEGDWTHFIDNQVIRGGRWVRERYGYLSLPLLARPNSIIPTGFDETRPDYDFADGVVFNVFRVSDGATLTARVPTQEGENELTLTLTRRGKQVSIQVEGAIKPWSVLMRRASVSNLAGAVRYPDPLGDRLVPTGSEAITFTLEEG
jgi:alpha-D-xyloside xylohydrolase